MNRVKKLKLIKTLVEELRSDISYSELGGYECYLVTKNLIDLESSTDQLLNIFNKIKERSILIIDAKFVEQ